MRRPAKKGRRVETARPPSKLRLLSEAGEALGRSLEYRLTLTEMVRRVVPDWADWCVVELFEAGNTPRQIFVGHGVAERVALWRKAEEDLSDVLRRGAAGQVHLLDEKALPAKGQTAEQKEAIEQLALKAYVTLP